MYNVKVTLTKVETALPAGIVFGHTNLVVTDAAGAAQTFTLNGSETPDKWSISVLSLSDGPSTYVASDVDANGKPIGASITVVFTPKATTFPATSGIVVIQA